MIILKDIYKRYSTQQGPGPWVLKGISLEIPLNTNIGLIGKNGAGKSTLLNIIGGSDKPTRGTVERQCSVSWPMGYRGGLQGSLTGRQNCKFISRIYGKEEEIADRLAIIQDFTELGDAFDKPVNTYSSGMRSRLKFGMSLAFDFDIYISDEVTSAGDARFKKKARAALRELSDRCGLIMVSHSEKTLRDFCSVGIWLRDGLAYWYDDINDALRDFNRQSRLDHHHDNRQSA